MYIIQLNKNTPKLLEEPPNMGQLYVWAEAKLRINMNIPITPKLKIVFLLFLIVKLF